MAEKYIIRVTAGSDYNIDSHVVVPVNSHEMVRVSNDFIDAEINVRVQNYHGLPRNSPTTSPYFSLEPHAANDDQYSLALRFTAKRPKKSHRRQQRPSPASGPQPHPCLGSAPGVSGPRGTEEEDAGATGEDDEASSSASSTPASETGISGHDLQFGNDFDHPIRDRLPPGFSYAMSIVKWWIDPGLDGDPYADAPYLYGPGLSSFNAVHVGAGVHDPEKGGLYFEEGGDEAGMESRRTMGCPDGAKERRKWALGDGAKDAWVFEYGRTYCVDFFNPYLDFNDFALRLPGFTLPIMKYWDGQGLRYVLRNRSTGDTYLVIVFTLHLKEDVDEDGWLKPAATAAPETKTTRNEEAEAGRISDRDDTGEMENRGAVVSDAGDDDSVD
ncbi:putative F-box domain-containing protein [Rosellinia necatrix]|uniref:Putative F-box domain-containing protein n=1 Tax=Rosellinia necatrix TaxID=77044 RepID=A0A1S7ULP0_ROSNE|nr:putative F-box domain-containing protein [Rosellinia necatrix]